MGKGNDFAVKKIPGSYETSQGGIEMKTIYTTKLLCK